jgi:hypothetical protein
MLRYAPQHFESLRPYRWRLERMIKAARPVYEPEHKALVHALHVLDIAARVCLSPEDYHRLLEPWIPPDA